MMKVFISWSGERSKMIASALRDWLPQVIQAIQPWMSESDIDKGTLWYEEISQQLKEAKAGIICLTPENLNEPWILFEAGAISKTFEKAYVCTYLFGLKPSEVARPLSVFMATEANEDDTRKLLQTLNRALGDKALQESQFEKTFDKWWPDLMQSLNKVPDKIDLPVTKKRSESEMLEEILDIVRSISMQIQPVQTHPGRGLPDMTLRYLTTDSIRFAILKALNLPDKETATLVEILRGSSPRSALSETDKDKE
jgi:hypothetical protein